MNEGTGDQRFWPRTILPMKNSLQERKEFLQIIIIVQTWFS